MFKIRGSTPGRGKFFFPIYLVLCFVFYLIFCPLAGFNLFILMKHHNFATYLQFNFSHGLTTRLPISRFLGKYKFEMKCYIF